MPYAIIDFLVRWAYLSRPPLQIRPRDADPGERYLDNSALDKQQLW